MGNLPELGIFKDAELASLGYNPVRVSIFDKWLSEEDVAHCGVINYVEAAGTDHFENYLSGEKRFCSFYEFLCRGGHATRNIFDDATGEVVSHEVSEFAVGVDIILSLREMVQIDISLENDKFRLLGGYDRTALILVKDEPSRLMVMEAARRAGLFVLS